MTDNLNDQELDDLLGALRANTPAMTDDAFAAGRARLETLDAGTPVPAAERPREPALLTLARPGQDRSPPHRAAPWLVAAAVLGVLAATGVVVPTGGLPWTPAGPTSTTAATESSEPPTSQPASTTPMSPPTSVASTSSPPTSSAAPPAAAAPVNRAGDLATNCADPAQRPGQYRYLGRLIEGGSMGEDRTIEQWVPFDPRDEWLERDSGWPNWGQPPTARRAPGGEYNGRQGDWSNPSAAFLAGLPRDPAVLYQQLLAAPQVPPGSGEALEWKAFYVARDLMLTVQLPADLRAALYRALGYHPGLTVVDDVRIPDGRSATAIGYQAEEGGGDQRRTTRYELLVDRDNCQPLGYQWRVLSGFMAGTGSAISMVRHAVVDRIGERPPG
jgi:hypothetical protein